MVRDTPGTRMGMGNQIKSSRSIANLVASFRFAPRALRVFLFLISAFPNKHMATRSYLYLVAITAFPTNVFDFLHVLAPVG